MKHPIVPAHRTTNCIHDYKGCTLAIDQNRKQGWALISFVLSAQEVQLIVHYSITSVTYILTLNANCVNRFSMIY